MITNNPNQTSPNFGASFIKLKAKEWHAGPYLLNLSATTKRVQEDYAKAADKVYMKVTDSDAFAQSGYKLYNLNLKDTPVALTDQEASLFKVLAEKKHIGLNEAFNAATKDSLTLSNRAQIEVQPLGTPIPSNDGSEVEIVREFANPATVISRYFPHKIENAKDFLNNNFKSEQAKYAYTKAMAADGKTSNLQELIDQKYVNHVEAAKTDEAKTSNKIKKLFGLRPKQSS